MSDWSDSTACIVCGAASARPTRIVRQEAAVFGRVEVTAMVGTDCDHTLGEVHEVVDKLLSDAAKSAERAGVDLSGWDVKRV